MKVLIISSSPRKSFSTSLYFSKLMKLFLHGAQTTILPLKNIRDYEAIVSTLPDIDVLIFATPVYVDTLPSSTLEYLKKLESLIVQHNYNFDVYAMVNCGFYEGHQCSLALNTFALWCQKAGVNWRGGIGIGAGVMLGFVRLLPLIGLAVTFLELILRSFTLLGGQEFSFNSLFSGYIPISLISQSVCYLIFSMGAFVNIFRLKTSILSHMHHHIKYTTVWFCPRFLFVFMATLYWFFRALLLHRVFPWQLFKKNLKN